MSNGILDGVMGYLIGYLIGYLMGYSNGPMFKDCFDAGACFKGLVRITFKGFVLTRGYL